MSATLYRGLNKVYVCIKSMYLNDNDDDNKK